MNRRGFLQSILVAAAAPAIVRADSLMRIIPRDLAVMDIGVGAYDVEILTIDQITREALRIAHENLLFIAGVDASFEARLKPPTIRYSRPVRFAR